MSNLKGLTLFFFSKHPNTSRALSQFLLTASITDETDGLTFEIYTGIDRFTGCFSLIG